MSAIVLREPSRAAPLYAERTTLRAVVDAALEGRLGTLHADDERTPAVARIDLGCYAILGGDPGRAAARALVAGVVAPREILFPDSDAWRGLVRAVHGARASERPMRAFATAGLDAERLRRMARPRETEIVVRPLDRTLARELGPHLEPHALQVFADVDDFVTHGVGYGAVIDGALASAATSYTASRGSIELAIATRPEWRGRGLAETVAAALMADCLTRGVVPHWNASNPVSQRLAVRLGYRPAGVCEVLFLATPP